MIVSCANCSSKYSVDDSKVEGKRFGFNCPKCGNAVEIDNREKKEKKKEIYEESSDLMTGPADVDSTSSEEVPDFSMEDNLGSELETALQTDEEEGSLNIEDMELPDLDGLGEISEAGVTSDEAIDIASGEMAADSDLDFDMDSEKEASDDVDLLAMVDSEASKPQKISDGSDLFEDFNPVEDDSLEINIPEEGILNEEEPLPEVSDTESDIMDNVKSDEIFSNQSGKEDEDENITIDLDSLDIQLGEDIEGIAEEDLEIEELSENVKPQKEEDIEITDFDSDIKVKPEKITKMPEDDEDITLDLDALDLTLDEVEELKEGETLDGEDERISLSDAGLTPEELVKKDEASLPGPEEEEDIRLSIDEVAPDVAPDVSVEEEFPGTIQKAQMQIDEDELPEIDLDKFEEQKIDLASEEEDAKNIHLSRDFREHEAEIANPDMDIRDTVPGGIINFSIDYSLRFSRIGAIFRLLCLFPIVLIPHFIVLIIYTVLSAILSYMNSIIIMLSGTHEENFLEIQENTIRYLLSICACGVDLVEDTPSFAGRKDIDYPFQMDVTYPIKYSRILAILRITVIGILLAALPHLILLFILTIGSILIYIIGLFSIIFRKKWPNVFFDFMVRYYRYAANILSFITGVIDRYPSFKFE